jgi:hypothetical protein
MIRHVFIWSVADCTAANGVLDELASLEQAVPGLQNWSIGKQIKAPPYSSCGEWQYILMADFETQADLDAYQSHPAHAAIVSRVASQYKDWAVVDYEI